MYEHASLISIYLLNSFSSLDETDSAKAIGKSGNPSINKER
jgi:hypothetical protein